MKSGTGMRPLLTPLLALTALLLLPACEEEAETGEPAAVAEQAPAPKKKKAPAKEEAKEAAEEEEAAPEFVYNALGRRDPYKSFVGQQNALDENRLTTPLQKYDLDQYRVVGVVWGVDDPLAMVEDPEGNGHFLKPGTLIGKNWGKVARINANTVVVAEEYRDFQGRLLVNEIVLSLPEQE